MSQNSISSEPGTASKSPHLFSTEQLEVWKDQVAGWWGKERLRYDHKRTVSLFQQWFDVSKEEAIQMEFNSREEPEKFVEHFLNQIVVDFENKLHDRPIAALECVHLSFQLGAEATVLFHGQTFTHDVPGHAGIVGRVHYEDGSTQKIFQRFISHPFWQYSHQSSKPKRQ